MDHDALNGDSLALAAREGRLHSNFQGYTTGGELDLRGNGPRAISRIPHLFAQKPHDLKAWRHTIEPGRCLIRSAWLWNGPTSRPWPALDWCSCSVRG